MTPKAPKQRWTVWVSGDRANLKPLQGWEQITVLPVSEHEARLAEVEATAAEAWEWVSKACDAMAHALDSLTTYEMGFLVGEPGGRMDATGTLGDGESHYLEYIQIDDVFEDLLKPHDPKGEADD